ncbi:FAD dependent oxidoreductase [Penicillium atrosanguineum]|nr:FAD dependent oxidoreductase [Penicillium atrosanguineum]
MSISGSPNTGHLPVENSTVPFWHRDLHELHDHRTTEELPESSDVVIIGAGYARIATAYHLVKGEASGNNLSATILEARGVCSGLDIALEVLEFEIAHLYAMKSLIEEEKINCDFTLTRSIDIWCNKEAAFKAKVMFDMLRSRNLNYMKDVLFVLGKDAERISGVKGAKACASFTAGTLWP